ncbi:FtsX-like permease family protein [Candidatus Enterococcus clewellii]|uniref:ABC3 transporter permease protein domain-containing protein n=1 Tax=Candidatus Enterococcus clewellii TaxID=1834193 RepID=A0A242KDM1_9ENTE|nr:FtsX-like permease family protein [Enterococcus sp. 9E7_DIV0242]OTP19169.1 hypothetical protein A5888_000983 [Enterococcus sp. 9E7_DIV0242]
MLKSLHYAFADLYYYKKSTLITTIMFSIFLLTLNVIRNLIDLNKFWISQLAEYGSEEKMLQSYQNWNSIYSTFYIGSIILFAAVISIVFYFGINERKSLVQKCRLLGFSKMYILKQVLVEVLIITLVATLIVSSFLLIFQNVYESVLIHVHSLAEAESPLITGSLIVTENIPASTIGADYQTAGLFSFDLQRFSLIDIFAKFNRNIAVLIGITLFTAALFTICVVRKSKVTFRK